MPATSRLSPLGRLRSALPLLLAATLLFLPLADVHSDTTLVPAAPGSVLALAALHPGAAVHLEASGTETVPRCPACDLGQQSAAALDQPAPLAPVAAFDAPSATLAERPLAASATPALSRGPPLA